MRRDIVQSLNFKKQLQEFDVNELASALEAAYLQQRRPAEFKTKYSFSPSTVGYGHGNCPRYWKFAFDGGVFADDVDALGVANMSYGTQAHARFEQLFEDAGILIDKEVEVRHNDPPIRGFIDVLVRWNNEVVVGEIKTTRQEAFVHRQATMKPAGYHLLQILTYMKITGKKYGFFLYENKNDQSFLIIPVVMDDYYQKIVDDVWDWMRTVRKAWEENTLAKRPWTKRNKICRSCPLAAICDENPAEGIDLPALEVPKL
jgi:CRISPR/Cas system-associated exonuclease Cas4 (RecB family)